MHYDMWRTHWQRAGFEFGRGEHVMGGGYRYATTLVGLPLWFVAIPAGFLPAWWVRATVQRDRIRYRVTQRLCASCGYDLRATPDRCPECGTEVTKA